MVWSIYSSRVWISDDHVRYGWIFFNVDVTFLIHNVFHFFSLSVILVVCSVVAWWCLIVQVDLVVVVWFICGCVNRSTSVKSNQQRRTKNEYETCKIKHTHKKMTRKLAVRRRIHSSINQYFTKTFWKYWQTIQKRSFCCIAHRFIFTRFTLLLLWLVSKSCFKLPFMFSKNCS